MPNTAHISPETLEIQTKANGGTEPQYVWTLQYFDPTEHGLDSFCGSSLWATKELALEGFYNEAIKEQLTEYNEAVAENYEDAEDLNPDDAEWLEQLARVRDEIGKNGEAYSPCTDQVVRLHAMAIWTVA